MNKALLFCVLLCLTSHLNAQVSGTIYFSDGTSQDFTNLSFCRSTGIYTPDECGGFIVNFENAIREVPIDKINSVNFSYIKQLESKYTIKSKTGAEASGYEGYYYIFATVFDKLTGEYKSQRFNIAESITSTSARLNIKQITFN